MKIITISTILSLFLTFAFLNTYSKCNFENESGNLLLNDKYKEFEDSIDLILYYNYNKNNSVANTKNKIAETIDYQENKDVYKFEFLFKLLNETIHERYNTLRIYFSIENVNFNDNENDYDYYIKSNNENDQGNRFDVEEKKHFIVTVSFKNYFFSNDSYNKFNKIHKSQHDIIKDLKLILEENNFIIVPNKNHIDSNISRNASVNRKNVTEKYKNINKRKLLINTIFYSNSTNTSTNPNATTTPAKEFSKNKFLDINLTKKPSISEKYFSVKYLFWQKGFTGRNITIGIFDSGVNNKHLNCNIIDYINFTDEGDSDLNGHGTFVSSVKIFI